MKKFLIIASVAFFAVDIFSATETVGGIEYVYSITNGTAKIGSGEFYSTSIPKTSSGALVIPSILGGCPVTAIRDYAFCRCGSITSVSIPQSVTEIGDYAFYDCRLLMSVIIPESVTVIGSHAFYDCRSLKSVTIPESVTIVGSDAFYGCEALSKIVGWRNKMPTDIEQIVVSGREEKIDDHAFSRANKLKSVEMSYGVKSIGESAFSGCTSLTSVMIPSSVTTIGSYAFGGCSSLTSVTIPSSVTTIESGAFVECTSLTSVTIPEGVTTIGEYAFSSCRSLTSVTIPSSVTRIGTGIFYGCSSLDRVDISDLKAWCECVRQGSVFSGSVRLFCNGEEITDLVIPDGVTTIGDSAFRSCGSLTSVTIPEGVTTIGGSAFFDCTSLTSVMIPSSVTEIEDNAFRGCSSLTSVTIPEGVTTIGASAFSGCSSLVSVRFEGEIPTIGSLAFSGSPWYEKGVYRLLSNASAEGTGGVANTVTVKQEVTHYVLNSVQPSFVIPATYDTGFVNVIAEVKGGCVAIPATWTVNYPKFTEKFGSDFTKALSAKTGKIAAGGREMLVWEDYVAGTDPTDPNDKFTASMTMVDGKPVVSWTPELDADRAALRKYTTYGKVKLTDSEWTVVPEGHESDYNFFKVTVEMK